MADRIAANADDLAVDELKRKARRRLIGAIVIALAAAVILPLLLEKEQKPLGDDVSVQIPPVDEGKFVNRLTGRSGESKSSPKFGAKPDAKADATRTEPTPAAASASVAGLAPAPTPAPDTAPVTATTASASVAAGAPAASNVPQKPPHAEAEQRVLTPGAKPAAKSEVNPAPAPTAETKPVTSAVVAAPTPVEAVPASVPPSAPVNGAAPAKPEGFAVQIAAFTDDRGANALAAKLKKAGYASSYIEPVETSRGTLWRVRVGGFASRPDADAARTKLKADGWNGLVVAAK